MATAVTGLAPDASTIPFDYAFRFDLEGTSGRVVRSTVTVSVEGTFVATAIGHGYLPSVETLRFGLDQRAMDLMTPTHGAIARPGLERLARVSLGSLLGSAARALGAARDPTRRETLQTVLKRPFRLNPSVADRLLANPEAALDDETMADLFQVVGHPGEVQFLYALFDGGSGREFQSEPILSTAGLGTSTGDRPFRSFPVPIRFEPRTTIRMEVTEISPVEGQLHVSLHGYKILGAAAGPGRPERARARRAAGRGR